MLGCTAAASSRAWARLYREHRRASVSPRGNAGYRIGTSTASRRYSAGNCLPSAASFGAS